MKSSIYFEELALDYLQLIDARAKAERLTENERNRIDAIQAELCTSTEEETIEALYLLDPCAR